VARILFASFLILVSSSQAVAGDPELEAMARGIGALRIKNFDKAIEEFSEAIRLDPNDFLAYKYRVTAYFSKKQYDNAIKDLSELIRLHPTYVEFYVTRGGAYIANKQYENGIKDFSELIRLYPTDPNGYCMRGGAYIANKQYDNAVKDFSEAIRLAPARSDAYSGRGAAYRGMKDYDKAIADSTEGLRLDPKSAAAHGIFAWVLAVCPKDQLRDGKRAFELATKACELTEWKNPFNIGALAAAYAACGDFKEAVKWQKKAIELGYVDEKDQQRLQLYEAGKPDRDD
jgi:tetratricopeptide (TPR) repeat protein